MIATMIRFVCASCGERLSVPDHYAGRKGVCPNCRAVNRVPTTSSTATTAAAKAAVTRERKAAAVVATPPAPRPAPSPVTTTTPASTAPAVESVPGPSFPPVAEPLTPPPPQRPDAASESNPKAKKRGFFGLRKNAAAADAEADRMKGWEPELANPAVLNYQAPPPREWAIDRRGAMPAWLRVTLFTCAIMAIIGLIWLFFFTLIRAAVG